MVRRFCERCLHHFDTIQACDRRMAGQDMSAMAITVLCIAKNTEIRKSTGCLIPNTSHMCQPNCFMSPVTYIECSACDSVTIHSHQNAGERWHL